MNEQLKSLTKLFSDILFRIPDFQRGYAWSKKEIEEFWNDLIRLKPDKNHYVGVLTLEPVKSEKYTKWLDDIWIINSKNYQPYYIVDGQQRITTSIILISAIIEIMEKNSIEKLNYTNKKKIIEKFLFEEKDELSNKTFLFSYEKDNPSYSFLIKKIFSQTDLVAHDENTIYNNNLLRAKEFFISQLEKMEQDQIEEIYKKITQHFLFNTYEISNDIDVYVSFETMNNRGKRLSKLELLKNRLIYISSLFKNNEDDILRLREQINTCWKNIYYSLGKNRNNVLSDDEFLDAHYQLYFNDLIYDLYKKRDEKAYGYAYYENTTANYLLKSYFVPEKTETNELDIKNVFDYINSLNNFVQIWANINIPEYSGYNIEIKEYLSKILYLIASERPYYAMQEDFYRRSYEKLLLCAICNKEKNTSILKSCLKVMEKYLFLKVFYPYEVFYSEKEKISFEELFYKYVAQEITSEDIKMKIEGWAAKIIDNKTAQLRLIDMYSKGGFYNKNSTPYILWEYEKDLQKQSKNGTKKIPEFKNIKEIYSSIEHIYPKETKAKYWTTRFTYGRKNTKVRNSIGNLLMLSVPKNGKLANKSFPEKCCNSDNNVGYKFGCYSEMEVAENDDWTITQIHERGIKIINFIKRRWGIKIDKKYYSKFLGIDEILTPKE